MPSPFPGMDPYIEASGRWGDFHGSFLAELRGALNSCLPEGFFAEIELQIWFLEPGTPGLGRRVEPDLYVQEEKRRGRKKSATATALVPKPKRLVYPGIVQKKHKNIRVVDGSTNRVVTVLELLSPSNKAAGGDRDAYLTKRHEYLANRVNFLELDLLRGGAKLPLGNASITEDYYLLASRSWEFPRMDYWGFGLQDPLPSIPIPLRKNLPEVLLPLRPAVDLAYDKGNYGQRIYNCTLSPRVDKKTAAWVRELLPRDESEAR